MGHKVDHLQFAHIPEHGGRFNTSTVQYDKSWDWLMGVVDKIEGTETEFGYYDVRPNVEGTKILDDHGNELIEVDGDVRFVNTFKAVVKWIKWYNSIKE